MSAEELGKRLVAEVEEEGLDEVRKNLRCEDGTIRDI